MGVDREVVRDREHPRTEAVGIALERTHRLEHAQEHFVGETVGILDVLRTQVTEDARAEPLEQRFERPALAPLGAAEEIVEVVDVFVARLRHFGGVPLTPAHKPELQHIEAIGLVVVCALQALHKESALCDHVDERDVR